MVKGWSIQKLSDLSYMKSGIGITEANIDGSGSYPCYGGNGLRGYASEYTHEGKFALIGRQGALCGNVTLVSGKFFASEHAVVVTPKTNTDIVFLSYVLKDLRLNQYSESSAQPGLSVNKVLEIECFVPNDETEQRCIAEALSDTDALLAAMEKLIAKKRAIKQGAMQELLTGKSRLPGFEGEWVEKKIMDFPAIVISGGTPSTFHSEYWNGSIPWMNSGELNNKRVYDVEGRITQLGLENSSTTIVAVNSVLIGLAGQGKTRGTVAINYIYLCTNQSIAAILPNPSVYCSEYLYQNLDSRYDELRELSTGDGGRGGLNLTILRNLVVPFPSLAEQTAIAEILSDMDAEIDALTAKLNKLRNIKQGMMSELLTGRIWLTDQEIVPKAAATLKRVEQPKRKPKVAAAQRGGHNQQFDDAVMIAGIVNTLYSDKYPLGRKKVQKCLYLLRRHQDESTAAFKKKAAGPYADEVRYKGGEPIALQNGYIKTQKGKQGTKFATGAKVNNALGYITRWGRQADIQWVADKLKFKKVDELELLATVDMAICDLTEAGTPVSVASIKHLIATNEEWKAKLKKQTFSDTNIACAIRELQTLF